MNGGVLQATWTTFRRLQLVPMLVAALSLLSWAAHAAGDYQCPDIRKGVCQPDATLLTSLPLNETELCCTACAQVKDCVGFTLNEQYCYLHSDWVERSSPTGARVERSEMLLSPLRINPSTFCSLS